MELKIVHRKKMILDKQQKNNKCWLIQIEDWNIIVTLKQTDYCRQVKWIGLTLIACTCWRAQQPAFLVNENYSYNLNNVKGKQN